MCAILEAIPKAIYITDANGRIIFYNKAAAVLWGGGPKVGIAGFCGSWKLYTRDGTSLCHDDCPLAKALKEKCPIRGLEAIAERPDGRQIHFLTCPSLIFNTDDNLVGAVNMLIDLTDPLIVDEAARGHGAIVESTDDAIIATDFLGTITSWNRGAQRLFGYTAEEVIGKSVTMLIPLEQRDEEPRVLMRICKGERIKHYETIRRRKDGSLVEISLAVSPIKNHRGHISGMAKIARDITERRQMEEQKNLLIREMDHRVKNLFELSSSIILLSSRTATTTNELASSATARLQALAKAHALTIPYSSTKEQPTTLHTLIDTIFAPYADGVGGRESRAMITGTDISVAGTAVTSLALLFHEFVTNAAKYGALSVTEGFVEITCCKDGGLFILEWYERNGPPIEREPERTGFGTHLSRAIMSGQLEGDIFRLWKREGLVMKLTLTSNKILGQ
ncbi:PAS domain S-box protein (plasmid) [Pseudomonas yamanorum]|nr:PAS domain S-box protein [Pseudomonas yamanorum]